MTDRRERLARLLEALAVEPHVVGAALVSRDGIAVLEHYRRPVHKETLAAMAATLLGAAEIATVEAGRSRARRVVAEADDLRVVVMGATPDLLLLAVADASAPLERLLARLEQGVSGVAELASAR